MSLEQAKEELLYELKLTNQCILVSKGACSNTKCKNWVCPMHQQFNLSFIKNKLKEAKK